jgi:membrane associated rhomboid family serine protease
MLILPLHHPLDRRQLPWATMLLVAINVFVFMALQSGDPAREAHARERYVDSGLAALEIDAYVEHAERTLSGRMQDMLAMLQAAPEPIRSQQLSELVDLDPDFQQQLLAGGTLADPAEWQALRAAHLQELGRSWTWRYQLQSKDFDPARLIGAAFLHGGWGHLIGNMLFLVMLGMLVEGAVGGRLLVLLYLLGAIGSSMASLFWHWGQPHAGLGASGSVAALMGAYCLIWGLRPVRFFYWFFVVFDYVRAPALLLFPAWLGWELFNLLANPDIGIGFEAHAGGLITGALFGIAVRRLGGVREDFLDAADSSHGEQGAALLSEAEQRLGSLQITEAEAALQALAQEDPDLAASPRAAIARYRCARYAGRLVQAGGLLAELLSARELSLDAQLGLLKEACSGSPRVSAEALTAGMERQLNSNRFEQVRALLREMPGDMEPTLQPRLWLKLALAERQGGLGSDPRSSLLELMRRFPQAPEAAKARVLLG